MNWVWRLVVLLCIQRSAPLSTPLGVPFLRVAGLEKGRADRVGVDGEHSIRRCASRVGPGQAPVGWVGARFRFGTSPHRHLDFATSGVL